MDNAAQLNNDAIDLLMRSSDDATIHEGIALFTKALRSLKQLLLSDEETSTESKAPRPSMSRSLASIVDSPCLISQGREQHPSSQYIYKRMFRLLPTADLSSQSNAIQIYIACVIFNSALLHQQQASNMEPGKVRTSLMEKSALLYHSCFQILPNIVSCKGSTIDDVSFLLKVGALNNSAQILYECDEFEQACDRLEMVETILCSQGIVETQCFFTTQEFEGILANVLLLRPPTVAVAA